MSNRPPYSASGSAFPPPNFYSASTGGDPTMNFNPLPASSTNTFNQRFHEMNAIGQGFPQAYRHNFMPPKPNIYGSNTINNNSNSISQPTLPPPRFGAQVPQYYPPHPSNFQIQPNFNENPFVRSESNSNIALVSNENIHHTQSVHASNFSANVINEMHPNSPQVLNIVSNNVTNSFNSSPQNVMASNIQSSSTMNFPNNIFPSANYVRNSVNSQALPRMFPSSANVLPPVQNSYSFPIPHPVFISNAPPPLNLISELKCEKEIELDKFLSKISSTKEEKGSQITIPEYRSVLKAAFSLLKLLAESKSKLTGCNDENEWNSELQTASNYQKRLDEICSLISAPVHLNAVMKKLKFIKRKKELKKKTKLNKLSQKIKMEQHRKELNHEIDKYLDDIKEKILKLKREAEMKKEADYILLEVRKKIHEAKRTIEKIKVLEKLRSARQANSSQKGLYVPYVYSIQFEKEVASLKETMFKQLADYEAEEKALKVMLETEQEGQLEEENKWKLKKLKTIQEKKKNHIIDCLFGNSEDPQPTDPIFLFHKYQDSANNSIENLVQIRQQWDAYLSEEGEAVPHQWVAPVPPSNPSWEPCLITSTSSKS